MDFNSGFKGLTTYYVSRRKWSLFFYIHVV